MKDHKVSIRYASSFLDSVIENKNLDSASNDMELISNTLEGKNQLNLMLKSPVIKTQVKLSILTEIFKDKVSADSLKFLQFVLEKRREDLLSDISKKFLELKDDYLGIINIEITTAYEFTDEQQEQIRKKFESSLNKIIKLNYIVNKELIGGFIARAADTMYDASIKHQLETLRKRFLSGNVSLN
ncbi:MAG: ATP synthase F1 subunit delta [Ignavibacteriaceae bacterium]|nr:ATP synthase F1 subunit delta [Ignavibacteriaceae bacterium]